MSKVKKYLEQAKSNSAQKYANADGRFDSATLSGSGAFKNAAGDASPVRKAPTSQPYVINVTSTSGAAVTDFSILGSNTYLYGGSGTWSNGSLTIGSITISSGTPGVTYQAMLAQFQQQPFTCGLTNYQSATTNQINQTLTIVTKDANGNESRMPIVPVKDPYQFQSDMIPIYNSYNVDGFTSIIISSVLANATITFFVYPAAKVDLARGLEGQSVGAEFSNPGIIKAQEVVVKN